MIMSELKACPFCGGEAKINMGDGISSSFVYCISCGASANNYLSTLQAIKAWNTRPPELERLDVDRAMIWLEKYLEMYKGGEIRPHDIVKNLCAYFAQPRVEKKAWRTGAKQYGPREVFYPKEKK